MKLKKGNKEAVIKLLDKITQINNIDYDMYDIIPSGEFDDNQTIFIHWYNCQDIILGLMSDQSYESLNEKFRAPANIGEKPKIPVGWYQTQFNEPERYMKGPVDPDKPDRTLSGYIPDRITDIIYHRTLNGNTKYKLIRQMLKDLKTIKKEFKK